MFPLVAFVREYIWLKALLMGYSMRLDPVLPGAKDRFSK